MKTSVRIALLGDLHLTAHLPYTHSTDSYRSDMLIEYLHLIFNMFVQKKVDLILTAGDVCHKTLLGPSDLELFVLFLELSRISNIPNVIVSGNHDEDGEERILNCVRRLDDGGGPRLIYFSKDPAMWEFDKLGLKIYSVPYMEEEKFLHYAKLSQKEKGKMNILLGHIGIRDTLHGLSKSFLGIEKKEIVKLSSQYTLMVFGHHHTPQLICDNGLYTGPIQQTRIDERDIDPGIWIVDLPSMDMMHFPNTLSPRFTVLENYEINSKKIEKNIVKPIIDTENKSEESNRRYLEKIMTFNPYYLISPRIKKKYKVDKGVVKNISKNIEGMLNVSVDGLNANDDKKKQVRKNVLELYRKISSGGM